MAQKGDFIGFTFNGTHSSDLGIVRTSNGSRYNSNLLPSSQDQTVAVPGGDGVYFFGTNYQTRVFQLQIASDEISETQLRQIQQTWGDKQIHELIFDEAPYKVYMAKCTNMPQFNFICFDENGQRVYKGEGSVEFTCYYPYAKSRYKFLDDYGESENPHVAVPEWNSSEVILEDQMFHNHHLLGNDHVDIETSMINLCNIDEWSAASGILNSNPYSGYTFDTPYYSSGDVNNQIRIYNPGDIETDFQLWFKPNAGEEASIIFYHGNSSDTSKQLNLNTVIMQGSDVWIQYDSRTELLTGYISVNGAPSSYLYNKYIKSGDFFKIPIIKGDYTYTILTVNAELGKIAYDYLYY